MKVRGQSTADHPQIFQLANASLPTMANAHVRQLIVPENYVEINALSGWKYNSVKMSQDILRS